MPNYFDQFDAPVAAPAAAPAATPNFFDQFDGHDAAAPAAPSALADAAMSYPSGVARGAAETAMLPVSLGRMASDVQDQASAGLVGVLDPMVRSIFGYPQNTPEVQQGMHDAIAHEPSGPIGKAQDAVRGVMNDNLYAPKTTLGHYLETAGEFSVPGGLPSKATRATPTLLRKAGEYAVDLGQHAAIPAVTSETAGQLTAGTPYEQAARLLGALFGNAGVSGLKAVNTPEAVLRRAAGPADAIDWERALNLQNNSTGIKLAGPEAIAHAQGGASGLPDVMKNVEGSIDGRAITAPFFAARPAQTDAAVGNLLDAVGPQNASPSTLGPRAAQAAEGAISASPEGQALTDAIFNTGPRTTAQQAGEVIQPALHNTYAGREGMRNATSDVAYEAARNSAPTIPVADLPVSRTVREPGYTSLRPGEDEFGRNTMQPTAVPPVIETPNMTSRTGPDLIQADARPVLRTIDNLSVNARGGTVNALDDARRMLYSKGGVDTSISGLESARKQIGDQITVAKQNGQMQTADHLLQVQRSLDDALGEVPAYSRANDTFKAGSQPLQPFETPGMAKVIQRDNFNQGFTTPPEQVPGAISSPSEAQSFNSVASPEARTAMGNHVATKILDSATDGAGKVSPERLSIAMRDNEDLLRQFPEIGQRLQSVADAAGKLPNARVGPIGDVAAAKDTTAAGNALLPSNPMVGSQGETADATRRLVAQDPETTTGLVRQNLGDRYAKASTVSQEGNREFAGAKFAKDVVGNDPKQATLDAIFQNLPTQDAAAMSPELFDVLQATARRKPIGSATAFNTNMANDMAKGSPAQKLLTALKSAGTSAVTNASDAGKRLAYRRSMTTLADMFTDPNSVEQIRDALGRSLPNGLGDAAIHTALQAPTATRTR